MVCMATGVARGPGIFPAAEHSISGPRNASTRLSLALTLAPRIVRFLHFFCFLHPHHYPINTFLE